MLGKTHAAIGTAAALAIMQPDTLPEMILGIGIASIGSIISDVDNENTTARRILNKITIFSTGIFIILIILHKVFNFFILTAILSYNEERKLISLGLISLICMVGSMTKHRTFMHSIITGLLLYHYINNILPSVAIYFLIGFMSHLILDILNYKGVQLLWPCKKSFKLGLCHSDGIVNLLLMLAGMAIIIVEIILFFLFKIIH